MIGSAVSEPLPNFSPTRARTFEQAAVQIEHVAGIRLAARRTLQHQRHLAIRDGLLGEIVVNDERVHAVIHEPFAHRRAGERREVLVRGGIGSRGHDDDGVRHRACLFQLGDDARDVRLLLADGDVNVVERAVSPCRRTSSRRLVHARLVDHRVHADGGLAGRTVADDQFALAAANRNHRVNGHDAGLHRLADGFAPDDAGRDFFHRIKRGFLDRPFAVHRLAEHVHHAAEQALAHRHGEQLAGGLDFLAFVDAEIIAEDDRADFGFFEVEREADDAVAEVEHLVEHRVGETFDLGHAVGDFADGADVLLRHRRLDAGDLGFDFLQ